MNRTLRTSVLALTATLATLTVSIPAATAATTAPSDSRVIVVTGRVSLNLNGPRHGERFTFDGQASGPGTPTQTVTVTRPGRIRPVTRFVITANHARRVQPASAVRPGDTVTITVTFPALPKFPVIYTLTAALPNTPVPNAAGIVQTS